MSISGRIRSVSVFFGLALLVCGVLLILYKLVDNAIFRSYAGKDMQLLFGGWNDAKVLEKHNIFSLFWSGAAFYISFPQATDVRNKYYLNGRQLQANHSVENLDEPLESRLKKRYAPMTEAERTEAFTCDTRSMNYSKTLCRMVSVMTLNCHKYMDTNQLIEYVQYEVGDRNGNLIRSGTVIRNKARTVYCIWSAND